MMSYLLKGNVSNKRYDVYRLVNNTRKEIYHGIATDFLDRYYEHSMGNVKATSHWDFKTDNIEQFILLEDLEESEASEYAHAFEYNPHKEYYGYKFIKTSGL